jgi:F-type H+-transporting ATPase subunit epsilon
MATEARTDKIDLEIVTPLGRQLATSVDEVTAPSVNGEFGVMPGHLPLLAAVRTGIVAYRQGTEWKRCAVGAGFAEAGANKLLILTDDFVEREKVDPVRVRKDLAEVQVELAKAMAGGLTLAGPHAGAEGELPDPLIKRENWLAAQLELYGDPPPATMRPFEQYGPPGPPEDSDIPVEGEGDREGPTA